MIKSSKRDALSDHLTMSLEVENTDSLAIDNECIANIFRATFGYREESALVGGTPE